MSIVPFPFPGDTTEDPAQPSILPADGEVATPAGEDVATPAAPVDGTPASETSPAVVTQIVVPIPASVGVGADAGAEVDVSIAGLQIRKRVFDMFSRIFV